MRSRILVRFCGLGLGVGLLGSCSLIPGRTQSPTVQAPLNTQTDSSQSYAPPTYQTSAQQSGQNATCDGEYYFATITWQEGQPKLTFGRKPSDVSINQAAVVWKNNTDGSTTYNYSGETNTTVTFDSNSTCSIQVVRPPDSLLVQENGETIDVSGTPLPETPTPTPSVVPLPTVQPPTQAPSFGGQAIACQGTIESTIDFNVYYSPDVGFYRAVLRPRTSNALLTANLTYSGRNQQGQYIWRGAVNGAADVAVIPFSAAAPQRGDQIAVQYDGRWGRGVCGGLSALW